MRAFLILYLFFCSFGLRSQASISGNFSPPKDFKWLIAYELTPDGETYVADTAVKEGFFSLEMPKTVQPGMYRLVYAVPQDEFYIDVIYDKTEDVKFNFSLRDGLTITNSIENKWYQDYFRKIEAAQEKLMEFYESGGGPGQQYNALIQELRSIQKTYEAEHVNGIAHQFIKSNKTYLPKEFQPFDAFLKHKKQHHFDYLNLDNRILQASNFLTDKISNYVFSALPTGITTKEELELEVIKNVKTAADSIKDTPIGFQIKAFHLLWKIAGVNTMSSVQDYIFSKHLKPVALAKGNQKIVDEIASESRLRIGAVAPEITWETAGKKYSLSTMEKAENYLLIFWSSTCSHCLNELPALHKELKKFPSTKVLAVGLEDDAMNWKKVSATLPDFRHAIALNKWESTYAQTFNIQKTPTYFILDGQKHFVAKPESDREVIEFLKN